MQNGNSVVTVTPKGELAGPQDPNPSALLQLAVQQNLDIDKLEKLMQLQERWQAQQARKEFLSEISHFQANCPTLEKTKKVDFANKSGFRTKYSYASLGDIVESIKKPLSDAGLSFRWEIKDADNKIEVTCIVSHLTGHSERTTMSAAKDESGGKNEIQQRGSSITYLQRYTLIAALGISTADEDLDGHKEDTPPPVQRTETIPPVIPKQNPVPNPQAGDGKKPENPKTTVSNQGQKPWLNPNTKEWDNAFKKMHAGQINMDDVLANYRISTANRANLLNPNYVYEPTNYEKFQPAQK
jgi:hypothetical protein